MCKNIYVGILYYSILLCQYHMMDGYRFLYLHVLILKSVAYHRDLDPCYTRKRSQSYRIANVRCLMQSVS